MTFISLPKRRSLRVPAAIGLAASLFVGALVVQPAPAAYAVSEPTSSYVFSDPNGANWTVPGGVSQIWVGIHGGFGGAPSGLSGCRIGGYGDQFSVLLDVQPGDVVTTFAGLSATGSGDQRIGGKGYLNGGNGGKRSLLSDVGGGGGGASAVKLNGELIAVAGGGGGCGGGSGHTGTGIKVNEGGEGGSSVNIYFGAGDPGTGSKPGAGGAVGVNDPQFAGYHKAGANGSNAGTGTHGGGGGGGGAGYPASGLGGGSGHGFAGFSGGGGGGAGLSWLRTGVVSQKFTQEEDAHQTVENPAADAGQTKITVPLTTVTRVSALSGVRAAEEFDVRVQTGSYGDPSNMLAGKVQLYVDGVEQIPADPGYAGRGGHASVGDLQVRLPGLTAGTHEILAKFTPDSTPTTWAWDGAASQHQITVEVQEPLDPVQDAPEGSQTQLELDLPDASVYGSPGEITVLMSHDGDQGFALRPGELTLSMGAVFSETVDLAPGAAVASVPVELPETLGVGEYAVVATYDVTGSSDRAQSAEQKLTITAAPTEMMLSAPAAVTSGEMVAATATVSAGREALLAAGGLTGAVELRADNTVLANVPVDPDGSVTFPSVSVPHGTTMLSARYLGDTAGNFAASASAAQDITVNNAQTSTTLEISESEVAYNETVTFTASVRNLTDAADPRGEIEVFFDGEVVATIPVAHDTDAAQGNAMAIYQLATSGFALGEHQVHARFVPAAGFVESATPLPTTLTVTGIPTVLAATLASVVGETPVAFDLNAQAAGLPTDGYVEAFLPADAANAAAPRSEARGATQQLGDAVPVVAGVGKIQLVGLAAGQHEVLLRFTPESAAQLSSEVTVKVTVAGSDGEASAGEIVPGSDSAASSNLSAGASKALSETGGESLFGLGVAAGALLLAAAGMLLVGRNRRTTAE